MKKTKNHIPELDINKHVAAQSDQSTVKTRMIEIDDSGEWAVVDLMVRAFEAHYPDGMRAWDKQLKAERREYNLAFSGDLKKSNFRNTLAFPVMRDRIYGDDDCLITHLERIFPDLLKTDSRHFYEFAKRYPEFVVPEKL